MTTVFSRVKAPVMTAILFAALAPEMALAHATFENATATQNSTHKAVLKVPHGCDGQATLTVRITVPEGIIAVKPMPKAGWTLATTKGDYAKTYKLYGKDVTSGVKEIVWSGGSLPDDQYDEFTFVGRITDQLPAGETVFVPVVQECASAKASWTEIPVKGQDPHDLKMPAPGLKIVAKAAASAGHDHGSHGAAPAPIKAGSLVITPPWSRATPGGAKVGGGYMTITNNGTVADRLIGGSSEVSRVFEVHEMKMEGSVMKMRALDKGLEIKPGETVELKPGGYHVMLIDLKAPLKEGTKVKGQLVFEKAGKVDVEFSIQPRGAAGAGAHSHH
jgi:uncharacterized protein YcnI/copper(I)-binding protein